MNIETGEIGNGNPPIHLYYVASHNGGLGNFKNRARLVKEEIFSKFLS